MTQGPASATGWTGQWVADRLDLAVETRSGVGGLTVDQLVGLALRRNPRRAHLLVSRVLGKHVPVDPTVAYAAGRLLGIAVADLLSGRDDGTADYGGRLLSAALAGSGRPAADALRNICTGDERRALPALVVGYAETATGLGHSVADALGADYLHSTRRAVPGVPPWGGFEEAHSHATSHLLVPEDPALFRDSRPLVLVDDELSTGATVLDTVRAVHAAAPRERYVVASLVDLRSRANRERMRRFADRLGVRIDVVSLAAGALRLPQDVVSRGQELVRLLDQGRATPTPRTAGPEPVVIPLTWPRGVRDGGRHGFRAADRAAFDAAVQQAARALIPAGTDGGGRCRLLVLGTEELMYLPMRLAAAIAGLVDPDRVDVLFSSTTRSPVVPVDDPGYAVRTAISFGSHDDPADGPGPRYAYNVAPPVGQPVLDRVLVVADDAALAWPPEGDRLLDAVAGVAGHVSLVTVPSYVPAGAGAVEGAR
jgi:hypothetical protein